jgi:hypothetical protein
MNHIITHKLAENRLFRKQEKKRLGRHIVHDPRSRDFPAKKAREIVSVTHSQRTPAVLPLDQGEVGSCTANAAEAAILLEPFASKVNLQHAGEPLAIDFYHDETELHPHDGIYPPADPGGSGLWIAKVLKNRGLIKSYSHAFGLDHALRALVKAPCIFGIDWYSSFDSPNSAGLVEIKPRARIDGGHEICAFGIDAVKKLVWFWQSWGKWGYKNSGTFCMSFDTLDRLLKNQGDCTQFSVA